MNVRGANQAELSQLSKLQHTRAVARSSDTTTTSATTDDSSASTVKLSKPAEMFKELKSLAQSDPEAFKKLASEISDQLSEAAKGADGEQASMLGELADKFASAAESGDVSSLEPPQHGAGGPKGPPPGGGGGPKGPPPGDAATGEAARANDAYKKHASSGTDSVKSALDAVFDLVQQRTSATA